MAAACGGPASDAAVGAVNRLHPGARPILIHILTRKRFELNCHGIVEWATFGDREVERSGASPKRSFDVPGECGIADLDKKTRVTFCRSCH